MILLHSSLFAPHLAGMGLLILHNCPTYHLDVTSSLSSGVGFFLMYFAVYLVKSDSVVGCGNFLAFMREGELQSSTPS